jgi:hypothetical protein
MRCGKVVIQLSGKKLQAIVREHGCIPGSVDELLVTAIGTGTATYGASRQSRKDVIEEEFRGQEQSCNNVNTRRQVEGVINNGEF